MPSFRPLSGRMVAALDPADLGWRSQTGPEEDGAQARPPAMPDRVHRADEAGATNAVATVTDYVGRTAAPERRPRSCCHRGSPVPSAPSGANWRIARPTTPR